jgi:hypothetical protein
MYYLPRFGRFVRHAYPCSMYTVHTFVGQEESHRLSRPTAHHLFARVHQHGVVPRFSSPTSPMLLPNYELRGHDLGNPWVSFSSSQYSSLPPPRLPLGLSTPTTQEPHTSINPSRHARVPGDRQATAPNYLPPPFPPELEETPSPSI